MRFLKYNHTLKINENKIFQTILWLAAVQQNKWQHSQDSANPSINTRNTTETKELLIGIAAIEVEIETVKFDNFLKRQYLKFR